MYNLKSWQFFFEFWNLLIMKSKIFKFQVLIIFKNSKFSPLSNPELEQIENIFCFSEAAPNITHHSFNKRQSCVYRLTLSRWKNKILKFWTETHHHRRFVLRLSAAHRDNVLLKSLSSSLVQTAINQSFFFVFSSTKSQDWEQNWNQNKVSCVLSDDHCNNCNRTGWI